VLGDVVTAAGGLPTDANGQVTTGAAAAYETGAAALGALAGQAAGGDAQSGLNTAVNSAANNYMAHVGDYVEALNACQQHPGGAGCGAILKMTQGSGVPIGSTPSGYAVAANVGADGAPTSYVVTSPSGRQMILQPQEWGAFSQMTPGQQAAVFSAPQWSLDLTSTIVYAGNGDIAGAEANYGNMLRSPSYWGSMAAGLAMGTLGTLATLPETVGVEAVATNNTLNFSQTTASPWFSTEGRFAGSTVSDIASQLRAGTLSPSDVPIQTIKIRGNNVVINTRSSLALAQAGIPQSQWRIVDMTGDAATEAAIAARLDNNGLTNSGTSTLRITGSGQSASTYVGSGSIPNPGAKQ
jgi:filamentous hemagglutinin